MFASVLVFIGYNMDVCVCYIWFNRIHNSRTNTNEQHACAFCLCLCTLVFVFGCIYMVYGLVIVPFEFGIYFTT